MVMASIVGRKATIFLCDAAGEDVELTAFVRSCSFETNEIEVEFSYDCAQIGAEISIGYDLFKYLITTMENSMTLIGGTIFSRN